MGSRFILIRGIVALSVSKNQDLQPQQQNVHADHDVSNHIVTPSDNKYPCRNQEVFRFFHSLTFWVGEYKFNTRLCKNCTER